MRTTVSESAIVGCRKPCKLQLAGCSYFIRDHPKSRAARSDRDDEENAGPEVVDAVAATLCHGGKGEVGDGMEVQWSSKKTYFGSMLNLNGCAVRSGSIAVSGRERKEPAPLTPTQAPCCALPSSLLGSAPG